MPVSRFTTSGVAKSVVAKSVVAKSRLARFMAAATFGAALAVLQPGAGFAYTPEQQQACTPDAMRLCSEFVPNVDAITACMIQKKAQLSPECAAFFRRGPEPEVGAPTSLKPVVAKKTKTRKPAKKKKTEDG